jgi:nitric oxide reductase NorQ protein
VPHELRLLKPEEYFIAEEPCYEPVRDEIPVFEATCRNRLPILLKGLWVARQMCA